MKTITEILNEMILKNKKEIENLKKGEKLQDDYIQNMEKELIKKIILILSISIILNSIAIIILNLWR